VGVWFKSSSNEGHFILRAETAFLPYVASHCNGVTQNLQVALKLHAPETQQVSSKSGSKEGHFILEGCTVFLPYLASHCMEVAQ
jgi:hypothetical protein